jgi:hypothetical protein
VGRRLWPTINNGPKTHTPEDCAVKGGAVLVEVVDTICDPRYPTSYKAGAAIIGRAPGTKPTSGLLSITYSFHGLQARHLRMGTSPMLIIQAKLFRRLQSADPLI